MKNLKNYQTWGTPQRLSEDLGSAPDYQYRSEISSYNSQKDTDVTFYREPKEWGRSIHCVGGNITWGLSVDDREEGLFIDDVYIESMNLVITMEEETEDAEETEFEVQVSKSQIDTLKFSYEIRKLPLILTELDITMNDSEDPHDWKIEATLGRRDDD
jgi:hypothetical protein